MVILRHTLAAAGSHACPPVTSGASLPLYETVNAFAAGDSADFGGALPAFRLDPGILADSLGADGVPVYARGANGYTLTTHGAALRLAYRAMSASLVVSKQSRLPGKKCSWDITGATCLALLRPRDA